MMKFFILVLISMPAFAVKVNVECRGHEIIIAADKRTDELQGAYICKKGIKVPIAIIKNENYDDKLDMEDSISFYVSTTYKENQKFLGKKFQDFEERFKEHQKETGEDDAYFQIDFKDLKDQEEVGTLLNSVKNESLASQDNSAEEFFKMDEAYRKRFYDPKTGRFLSPDPAGLSGGDLNPYRYVNNQPTRYVDPYGLYYERPPADSYSSQVYEGSQEFMQTYFQMIDAQLKNSDHYFHCLANCRAAKAGPGGLAVASVLSITRELYQLPSDGVKACGADMAANIAGQQAAQSNQSCSQSCHGYAVNSLISPSPWN